MNAAGLTAMLGIGWRTHRRPLVLWVIALPASMVGTAAALAGLYDTPAKIHTYAAAVTSGNALLAINGKVEGIDSLGGIIQDEFGFLAAFLLPLLGISLMARFTRREEEAGRLEAILAGRVARHAPLLAALVMTTTAILLTAVAFAVSLSAEGVAVAGALLYCASLGALAFVFAGIAALLAQVTLHTRGVYTGSLVILVTGYGLRGVGDVTHTWITWLSPLGWAEKAAPFGPARWWALLVPILVGAGSAVAAIWLAARRDLGSALIRAGAGPAHASPRLRNAAGLATWIHRPAMLGWLTGAVILAAMMGSLAQQLLDAIAGNQALADAIGTARGHPEDGLLALTQLYLAIIGAGYVVQAVGSLRTEETSGRIEPRLAGTLSRRAWLTAHGVVILGGLIIINLVGSTVLGVTTALSVGNAAGTGRVLAAGAAYLPAEMVLAGLALALFGLLPRAFPLASAAYAVTAFIAFLGPGLKLPGWVRDLAVTTHIGNPPLGAIDGGTLTVLATAAATLVTLAFVGFRRRGIPQG